MDISHSDFKQGIVKLRVTDPDDLWYLSHIIDPGDLVTGKTTRKIKIGQSENAKVAKKTLTLTIEAEQIDYTTEHVRINGKIRDGPEDIPRDAYHAIAVEVGSDIKLQKTKWLSYQKQKLEEATQKKYNYLLCLFDREEMLLAITKKRGYDILVQMQGEVAKKSKTVAVQKDFHQEIIKLLEQYNARHKPEAIILASPAFYKEDLLKKVNNPDLKKKIVLATCSSISRSALDEVMKRPELATLLQMSRSREEKILMDELLLEISRDGKVAYGWEEAKVAVSSGAVQKLLLSDKFIQQKRASAHFGELDEIMKTVDDLKGEIHIISSEQESGRRLDGLGGIAGLLRYKL